LGKATIAALTQVVFQNRAKLDEIADPNTTNGRASAPGTVTMLVETEPARFPSLQGAVDETRAAGVLVTLVARFVFMKPRITAKITPGLTGAGKQKIQNDMIAALEAFVDALASGDPAKGQDMIDAIKKVKDVTGVVIVDVRTSRSVPGQEGSDPLVEALAPAIQAVNAQDANALRAAIKSVIDAETPALLPSGRRDPDRSVIQGLDAAGKPTGQQATDTQIETGKFQVVPPAGFSIALDMEPADICCRKADMPTKTDRILSYLPGHSPDRTASPGIVRGGGYVRE